ncbi:ATP-binding protein [Bacillus salipaludis]|uniref:ATP-binding protein n=1 Tax=Bacillus salipaludis TaxID=2547811 RepID=A0ABW8RRJ8_9BACI
MNEHENFRNITQAVYVGQAVVDFQGNPLIEALPPIMSPEEAYDKLSYYPPFDEKEVLLPTHIRYHAIPRINQFFQPVMQHLDLEQRFSRLLRHGYVSRNPRLPDYNRALNGSQDIRSTASSMTLMGFSGIGKTTVIERILSIYPQVILHEYPLNLVQVVWLKLNCPHDGSLKSLCLDFFLKMDQLLGTNYYEKFGSRRNSISSMVTRMGQIARLHCIGAIVIDEIQHLLATRDNNSEKMMNFFVTLINEVGVPVLLIGTMRAKAVLQQDFRQARRGSGQGDMVWQQMKKDDDWELLIESLWEYQWIQRRTPLTEEINQTLYDESQGIVDIAVKLFALAQGRAIETGMEQITPAAIKQVAKDDLKLVQPMLKALRDGRTSELEKYADIMPMDIEEYLVLRQSKVDLRATIQKKKEVQAKKRQEKHVTHTETIMSSLIALGIDAEIAQRATTRTINEHKNSDLPTLMKSAIECAELLSQPKVKTSKHAAKVLLTIIEQAKKNKQSNYEALKQAGYIKSPMDEFAI